MLEVSPNILQKLFTEKLYAVSDFVDAPDFTPKEVVVLFKQDAPQLHTTHEQLLSKILQAVSYNLDQVQLINVRHSPLHQFAHIQQKLNAKYLLAFGIASTQLGLNFQLPYYHSLHFQNCQLLLADDLTAIAQNINKKKLLWKNLKQMFVV